MARVTVEDCIEVVNNRFELVLLSAQRARNISAGQLPQVDRDNDKNPVVALREIAERKIELTDLMENIVRGVNRHADKSEEDELLALLQSQEKLPGVNDDSDKLEESGYEIDEVNFEDESEEKALSDDDLAEALGDDSVLLDDDDSSAQV